MHNPEFRTVSTISHQGNNRGVVDSSGKVEETNHYYPFGGAFASTGNVQPYKYNGKELDAKKGIELV